MRFTKRQKKLNSRDKVKHDERSDQLFLERMMKVAEQLGARVTTDEERESTARTLSGDEVMKIRRLGSCENLREVRGACI